MEKDLPIGVIDSGVGGLTVAKELREALPNESILYFGDSKNMPYGNRDKEEILQLATAMIDFLSEKGVKAILLACNTISSYFDELKPEVKLISIVDAGIKAACDISVQGEAVGLIATKATVQARAYEKANERRGSKIQLVAHSSTSLPKIIDSELGNAALLKEKITECIEPIVNQAPNISKLILGCSHFPIIKEEISAVYPSLDLIDPAVVQVQMLKEYLRSIDALAPLKDASVTLYTSGEENEFNASLERLNLKADKIYCVK